MSIASILFFLAIFVTLFKAPTAQPAPMGPYSVNSSWYNVSALDRTNPSALVVYPSNGTGPFPLISYLHGFLGGGIDLIGYVDLFGQIASYGFVVVAPDSCNTGCTDPSQGAPWSDCAGLPEPTCCGPQYSPWYAEGLKVIDWAKNMSDAKQDPLFQLIDWSQGVGFAGHSMGGQAAVIAANAACTSRWNIRAVVVHHPAPGSLWTGQNLGVNISVPTVVFTSSGDTMCPPSWSKDIMNAIPNSTRPIAYRNEVGWSHLEPVLVPPIENPLLATFTAAWFKLYVSGDASWHSTIYGNGPATLCGEASQVECWATET